jgi:hypothetical protein
MIFIKGHSSFVIETGDQMIMGNRPRHRCHPMRSDIATCPKNIIARGARPAQH